MEVRYGMKQPCRKRPNLSTFHRMTEGRTLAYSDRGDHVSPGCQDRFEDTRTPGSSFGCVRFLFVTTRRADRRHGGRHGADPALPSRA
jgi:hypothetical protein